MKTRIFDVVIIGISLVAALVLFGYAKPLVIAPLTNVTTSNSSVLFAFDKADTILIDKSPDFTNPRVMHAQNDLIVTLSPGTYYWKVKGIMESEVHEITILSTVDLRVKSKGNESYEITNAGSVPLSVSIYNNSVLEGNISLSVYESGNASGNLFVGRENGS